MTVEPRQITRATIIAATVARTRLTDDRDRTAAANEAMLAWREGRNVLNDDDPYRVDVLEVAQEALNLIRVDVLAQLTGACFDCPHFHVDPHTPCRHPGCGCPNAYALPEMEETV